MCRSQHRQPVLMSLILALLSGTAALPVWSACEVPVELRNTRPDPEGQATEVRFGIMLIDLQSIQDSAQSFTADIYIVATWKDTRLISEDLPSVWWDA